MDHRCHVDHEPCEVVAAVAFKFRGPVRKGRRLDLALLRDHLVPALPCAWCREVHQAAASLAKVRLGRHERNILLHAPPADSVTGAILDPSLKTHSDRETYLRAVRKLARAGLIKTGTRRVTMRTTGTRLDGSAVDRVYAHRTMWLTPFGAEVIACYRKELEEGRPIRWMAKKQQAELAARRAGVDLLAKLGDSLARLVHQLEADPAAGSDDRSREIEIVARKALETVQQLASSR